jgi:hypothetical protein
MFVLGIFVGFVACAVIVLALTAWLLRDRARRSTERAVETMEQALALRKQALDEQRETLAIQTATIRKLSGQIEYLKRVTGVKDAADVDSDAVH